MKAIRLHAYTGAGALVYEDAPKPAPRDGEVLVRVHGAGVITDEFVWATTRSTRDGRVRPLPLIMGHEFSGTVGELGRGVTGLKIGDEVYGLNDWFEDGAEAEYCIATPAQLAPKPKAIDHVDAAALPISGLTAWQGLFDRGNLSRGQRVLIHGAAGGVGVLAVQLAKWRGADVVATASGSDSGFLHGLGAGEVIDYHTNRFDQMVRDFDLVFDTVGGETLARSRAVLKPGGKLVTIAAGAEGDPAAHDAFFIVEANRRQLIEMAKLIDAQKLRPTIGRVIPLAEGPKAYAPASPGERRGKIVMQVA